MSWYVKYVSHYVMDVNQEGEGHKITAHPYGEGRKMKYSKILRINFNIFIAPLVQGKIVESITLFH